MRPRARVCIPHTFDHNMVQPRTPNNSFWKGRSKIAMDKAKKRILEGMKGDKPAPINYESDESSDEEAASKHKTPLSYHSTRLQSLELKSNYPPTISSSHSPSSPRSLTLNHHNPPIPCPPHPCHLPPTLTRLPLMMIR